MSRSRSRGGKSRKRDLGILYSPVGQKEQDARAFRTNANKQRGSREGEIAARGVPPSGARNCELSTR